MYKHFSFNHLIVLKHNQDHFFSRAKILLVVIIAAGCSLEKKSGFNRDMQNLTARYNILFNANELLRLKQESMAQNYQDNYQEILSVYQDTAAKTSAPDKDLQAVIDKANTIIDFKEQSHYIGDAYFDMAKANYLKGSYFNSIEYFNYVIRTYPKRKDLVIDAMAWQARALMKTGKLNLADTTLDTALMKLDTAGINKKFDGKPHYGFNVYDRGGRLQPQYPKPYVADVFATRLQYDIYVKNYTEAEEMAIKAIKYTRERDHRLRWTYILAQIQDINHHTADAVKNFSHIENSNSPYEMAFNASLNRIRIQDEKGLGKHSRADLLRRLLNDDKNKDFIDQIYFQIGELYLSQNKTDEALKNYLLSAHNSTKNLNQKGLAYLRIADINFSKKADYPTAKKYYDSTLFNLSHTYTGYAAIQKKNANLQYLIDRLQTISREDTLQMLSKLTDSVRKLRVDAMFKRISQQQQQNALVTTNTTPAFNNGITSNRQTRAQSTGVTGGSSTFYFYNTAAQSQGYADFKRIWGNRPLTDDWRRSQNNNLQNGATTNITLPVVATNLKPDTTLANNTKGNTPTDRYAKLKLEVLKSVPVTDAQISLSNSRIYNAYLDIGNLYRDVLDDHKEAINTYELLLSRFSANANKPLLYYNLYRLYTDVDTAKSAYYKNLILNKYAETTFARIITDPNYIQKLNDRNAVFNSLYDSLFNTVTHRRYKNAIDTANLMINDFANNIFIAQVYYLRAIAEGHLQKLDPFKAELEEIRDKFTNDQLIAPLVKQHLTYIAANEPELSARPVVLVDENPTEIPFALKTDAKADRYNVYLPPLRTVKPATIALPTKKQIQPQIKSMALLPKAPDTLAKSVTKKTPDTLIAKTPVKLATTVIKVADTPKAVVAMPAIAETPSIFSMSDSTNYYFVVWVNTNTVNLAPSRFGIGQFNRANYANTNIKHQLKNVELNQLIYVGRFNNLAEVKTYARAIVPLLPSIMKTRADEYNFFIITQQNMDKLADGKTLMSYYSYYQKHY